MFKLATFGWCALDKRYHDVHKGRGGVGLCDGLCLCTTLMNDVYDLTEYTKMVEYTY